MSLDKKERVTQEHKIEYKATREGFSEGLIEAAKHNEKVYAVCADLSASVGMKEFSEKFPLRFVEVGVAEQNLVTVASGLAMSGKIPYAASFSMFSPGRNWEQIRTTICYNNQPVKIIGSHVGLGVGEDGATHQALEDVALMRVLPNMEVIVPCDAIEAKKAAIAISKTSSPTYMRIFRQKTRLLTDENTEFIIGKINVIGQGNEINEGTKKGNERKKSDAKKNIDVCIISSGPILSNVIDAAASLKKSAIKCAILNVHTIKPLDENTIIEYAKKSKLLVVVEDHQIAAGLGGAIAETLSAIYPKKILFIGVKDSFGESGKEEDLYKKYKLDSLSIANAIRNELKTNTKLNAKRIIKETGIITKTIKSSRNRNDKRTVKIRKTIKIVKRKNAAKTAARKRRK